MPLVTRVEYVRLLAEEGIALVDHVLDDFGPGAPILHPKGRRMETV